MGIQVYENQGAGTYWGPVRGKKWLKKVNLKKIFFSGTGCPNTLIFDI